MAAPVRTKSELMSAVRGLSAARDLPVEKILEALEEALRSAYRKIPDGTATNITVEIDEQTGETRVFAHYAVVEEKYVQDPNGELSVEQAAAIQPGAAVGDDITVDKTPHDFGRIAAQTAKQVILQKIREAEREQTFTTYQEREGEIVYGTIQTIGKDHATVSLDRVEAVFPKSGQIPGERLTPNARMRFYVSEVKRTPKGPQVVVTRTQREMLKRLMELEIPEIFQGIVEIKAIAREAGSRSKVAVWAHQEGVDPVGACVGMRGVRIQALVRELGGEKIDIVPWDPEPKSFIANALSPSKALFVGLDEDQDRRTATVVVPDSQLSLAIGREGQNARLAAKLTGWRIDIRAESEAGDILDRQRADEAVHVAERTRQAERDAAARAAAEAEAAALRAVAAAAARAASEEAVPAVVALPEPAPQPVPVKAVPEVPVPAAKPPAKPDDRERVAPVPEPVWVAPLAADEEEEPEVAMIGGKKRKQKKLVRDPRTGQLVVQQERKGSRQRHDWEEEVEELERWTGEEIDDTLLFTEDDFLADAEEEVQVGAIEEMQTTTADDLPVGTTKKVKAKKSKDSLGEPEKEGA